jgi:hypothetical protein
MAMRGASRADWGEYPNVNMFKRTWTCPGFNTNLKTEDGEGREGRRGERREEG